MMGYDFYDDPGVWQAYQHTRGGASDLNARVEAPAVEEFVGAVLGQEVVELGCGAGGYGRALLEAGARRYEGIDGSARMVAAARQELAHLPQRASVTHGRLEDWTPPPAAADLVVARMSLHYVDDLVAVLGHAARTLRPDGRLVASVEHPVVTSSYAGNPQGGVPSAWNVTDYFCQGQRHSEWLGSRVVKYHRTMQAWWSACGAAGLRVVAFSEGDPYCYPHAGQVEPDKEPRRLVPMYLVFKACPDHG